MSPAAFCHWLAAMKAAGLASSDAAAGRLLGVSADTIVRRKTAGASVEVALACRALLHRMEPYA